MFDSFQNLFKALYGELVLPLAVVDGGAKTVVNINASLAELLGVTFDISTTNRLKELFVLDTGKAIDSDFLQLKSNNKESFCCRFPLCESSVFQLTSVPLELTGQQFYVLQVQSRNDHSSILKSADSRLTFAINEASDGLWDWNAQTNEVYFSPKLDHILGFEPGERTPCFSSWFDLVHPDDAPRVMENLQGHLDSKRDSYDVEYRIRTKQGEWKQVRDRGLVCEHTAEGQAVRAVGMLSDITAYRQLEQELRTARQRFEDYALCRSDWFWEADERLNIIELSSQFFSQTGIKAEEIRGRNLLELLEEHDLNDAVEQVKKGEPFRNIRLTIGRNGYWISVSARPVTDKDGTVIGYRGIGENINDQVVLENMVTAYQQNAEIMMERAPVAIGIVDGKGQFFFSNDAFLKLVRADNISLAEKYRAARELSKPDKQILQSDESYSYEMVLETLDGPKFYSVMKYRLYRADHKDMVVVTVAMDITFTRQQEVEQKKIEMVLDSIAEGILITDAEHRIVSANRSLQETTGFGLDELLGNTPAILSSGRYDRSFYQELWNEVHQSGKWRGDIWNRCKNGAVIRQHVSIQAIQINGQIQHYIGIYSAAFQACSQRDSEMFAQQHDPLTGLPNRQLLQDRLHMACLRARASRMSIEITLIRIKNMTAINDQYGHTAGDQILKKLAFMLQDVLSLDDTIARYGASEFVLIRERALEITADSLVGPVLEKAVVLSDGSRVFPEYAMTFARYPENGSNPQRLMRSLHQTVPEE
ncbi:sensor domain-containing diguanylate cyclase [Spongorhabdus nitratireducens]